MIKSLYKFCVNDKNVYFFNMKELKVAVVCNEPHPEFYIKSVEHEIKELDFVPYFEVEDLTPIEEYEILTEKLNKSRIKAYLLNIPYTGAPPMALANCQSKVFAKRLLNSIGIQTPRFTVFKKPAAKYKHNLKFPLMVKPAFEDASVGIENESIVQNNRMLKERIDYVFRNFVQPVLVEEFINVRELNVAILGDTDPKALPISEITFDEMPDHLYNIVSYQAKWDPHHESYHKTIPVCPAKLPKSIETKAKQIALNSFKFMGARDYARVDMRLSKDNELYVLEVNPNPDLTEGAGFMRSMDAEGYSYVRA
ncbi:MAG: ATP-grasp domain-containing protein, partial [Ignavibacteriaceae bacterium]